MTTPSAPPAPTAMPPRRPPWRAALLWLLAAVLALLLVLGAGATWLWRSDSGLRWLLSQVPGLQVGVMQGRPDGGAFAVSQLDWRSGDIQLHIEGLSWRALRWRWRPHPGAWLRVELDAPQAQSVALRTSDPTKPPPPAQPRQPPASLRLPLELVLRGLQVQRLQVDQLPPVTALQADLHLGDQAGALHRVERLTLQAGGVQASASGDIATGGEMALRAELRAAAAAGAALPWQAQASVSGPLARLALQGALRAAPLRPAGAAAGVAAPSPAQAAAEASAQVQATVLPFARWPLGALQASTDRLDLSMLSPALPRTALSGRVTVNSSAADAPIQGDIAFSNASAGRWSDGALPLRTLRGSLQGSLADRQTLEASGLQAELAGTQPGGRISGSARWQGQALALTLALDGLRPAQLDARAPAMLLSGPLTLSLQGLPSPDDARQAGPLSGRVQAQIDGRLDAAGTQPVRLLSDAAFDAAADGSLALKLDRLQLSAGAASATLQGQASRDAARLWALRGKAALTHFDPALWWPGPDGPQARAWRRGPHDLNAALSADLRLPSDAINAEPRALLLALRGQAELQLQASRLAGVSLQGRGALSGQPGGATLDAALRFGGDAAPRAAVNQATAQARLTQQGSADRLQLDVDAPALAALAPLVQLAALANVAPGTTAAWPTAGSLRASAVADGRWPAVQTQGELHAAGLVSAAGSVGRADLRWQAAGLRPDAPLSLDLAAEALTQGRQRIDSLKATLTGSLREHRLQLRAASPVRPPAWADAAEPSAAAAAATAVSAATAPAGTLLQLQASGAWQPGPANAGGGNWRGHLSELLAAPRSGIAPPWVAARDIDAAASFGADGRLVQATLAPGQIALLGASLRWTDASYAAAPGPAGAAGSAPRIRLDARLEPVAVAPWLARWQPQAGWSGDLRLGASLQLRSAGALDADLVLERAGGDLSVVRDGRSFALGITALRLALAAHGGNWLVTQAFTGTQLGVLAGSQTVKASPSDLLPPAASVIDGVVEVQIPDIDVWSAWLPAGWRLGGTVHTSAALSGRVGAPEYSGRIAGSALTVSNLLEGVDLKAGELLVALRGTDARIERGSFQAGAGSVRVEGGASFGATPSAELRLVADKFEALGRIDRRIVLSGNATLALRAQSLAVDGRFTVDEGRIDISQAGIQTLDADVVVENRMRPAPGAPLGAQPVPAAARPGPPPPAPSAMASANVNLQLDLGKDLRLRGRGIDTGLTGLLRVTTPGGRLAVNGIVRTEAGSYKAYGQNLSIERGVIRFSGDVATPQLDILAVRPDIDVRAGVLIQGSAIDPRVRLYSEPALSDLDTLSWVVNGRASEGLGRADTALLQQAALALLAGEKGGSGDGFVKRLGLDALSVGQTGSGDTRDTVVTVGKQLSKRLFIGYERGLNATAGSWQMIYRIAQRFTLRAQTGDESAVDLIWTWRWD